MLLKAQGMQVSAIARALLMPRPTVDNILRVHAAQGLIVKQQHRGGRKRKHQTQQQATPQSPKHEQPHEVGQQVAAAGREQTERAAVDASDKSTATASQANGVGPHMHEQEEARAEQPSILEEQPLSLLKRCVAPCIHAEPAADVGGEAKTATAPAATIASPAAVLPSNLMRRWPGRKKAPWSDEQRAQCVHLSSSGLGVAAITRLVHIPHGAVKSILKLHAKRYAPSASNHLSAEQHATLLRIAREQAGSYPQVAAVFREQTGPALCPKTVRLRLKAAGLAHVHARGEPKAQVGPPSADTTLAGQPPAAQVGCAAPLTHAEPAAGGGGADGHGAATAATAQVKESVTAAPTAGAAASAMAAAATVATAFSTPALLAFPALLAW